MALDSEDRAALEKIADSLEGIEILLAMWVEHSLPAGEIWVEEGPDRSMAKKPWRVPQR